MIDLSNTNLMIFAGVLVIGLLLVWYLFGRSGTSRQRSYKPDVLDEGVGPAQRNQALIDAPPAAQIVPPPVQEKLPEPVVAAPPPPPSPPAPSAPALVEVPAPVPTEPDVPAPEPEPEPEPVPAPPPTASATSADDLSRIKGLGPKLQRLLPELGITTFAQIAALTEADLAELDTKLGAFAGRPAKDSWVEQAKFLAAGDTAGFEDKFGKV